MEIYPYKFGPIYTRRIWGGRSLHRLFDRKLPTGKIGESWELADLPSDVSLLSNGPDVGASLSDIVGQLGRDLLGSAAPTADGHFPLLLKLLDANDILSLQVHPDEQAAGAIDGAAVKAECWYIMESRDGFIYKGLKAGVAPAQMAAAASDDPVDLVRRFDVRMGDFHNIPAGLVHALGSGVVLAEIQSPSDTTYRVTDWGRGREIHVDKALQCIRFEMTGDECPGRGGDCLLATEYFSVFKHTAVAGEAVELPAGRCAALMILKGRGNVHHLGRILRDVRFREGDTLLLPAALRCTTMLAQSPCQWLEITLPEK